MIFVWFVRSVLHKFFKRRKNEQLYYSALLQCKNEQLYYSAMANTTATHMKDSYRTGS